MKLTQPAIGLLAQAMATQQYWMEDENLTAALRDWDTELSKSPTSNIVQSTWEVQEADIDMSRPEDDRVIIRCIVNYLVMEPETLKVTPETIYVCITVHSFCNDGHDGWQR